VRKTVFRFIFAAMVSAVSLVPVGAMAGMEKFVAMGTGSTSGTYYPVGKGICELVNDGREIHRMRCIAYNTGGSVYNIQAITSGELEVGITRSDLAYQAFQGEGAFRPMGPNTGLRAMATLYSMPIAILVRKSAEITTFENLKGKRINIGNKGSGKRSVADLIFNVMGWSEKDFSEVLELPTRKMGVAFCDDKVDILIEGLGNPAAFYKKMVSECDGAFIPVPEAVVAKIKKKFPFYASLEIPGKMYAGTPDPVATFGFKATLVTRRDVHPDTIYNVVKSIFGNFGKFQDKHPSLKIIKPQSMVSEGIFIPLHEGAVRYYKENGFK
jgi:hypothetical protein